MTSPIDFDRLTSAAPEACRGPCKTSMMKYFLQILRVVYKCFSFMEPYNENNNNSKKKNELSVKPPEKLFETLFGKQ